METPPVIQSSPGTGTYSTVPPAPTKATPVIPLDDEPAKSSIDYSRLRISDNKSFSEAYIEAVKLNEEQVALRSLQMIHNVSSPSCALYTFSDILLLQ